MKEETKEGRRVLLVNVTCGSGSTGRIVTGIYDELERRGYTCRIAYGRGKAPEGYDAFRVGTDLDVYMHGGISRLTDRQGFYSGGATRHLIRKIREFGPDIVHLHNIHGYFLNVDILFRFLKKSGIHVIWTLHDCWSFTGHCTHFEFLGCSKWMNCCGKCDQLKEYPKSILMDSSKKNYLQKKKLFADMPRMTLVTPSVWLKNKVAQSYMNKYAVSVVPTGIDLKAFRPRKTSLRQKYGIDDKFVILGAASPWRDRKGLGEFKKLSKALPDRYVIVLVGMNSKQITDMEKSCRNVIALPRTESVEDMASWYSAADAFVNLTLEDTFPTTNLEALACGTPVVTYKAGGSPESITPSCGFATPRTSIDGVIAALDMIRTGPSRKEACVRRAAEYSMKKRFRQYYTQVYAPLEEQMDAEEEAKRQRIASGVGPDGYEEDAYESPYVDEDDDDLLFDDYDPDQDYDARRAGDLEEEPDGDFEDVSGYDEFEDDECEDEEDSEEESSLFDDDEEPEDDEDDAPLLKL